MALPFLLCLTAVAPLVSADEVSFQRDIRPILSQHCFPCHGPDGDAREAGLSLVTFDEATSEIEPGVRAIVPGDRAASAMWRRITSATRPMPPRDAHKPLAPEQVDHLGAWIDAGASYAPHWAYVPPAARPAPDVSARSWPRDDVDRHILARLEQEGLLPARDATRETLIRRATLDVIGLPPRPRDIDAFLEDDAAGAFARVVDRLLADEHFGERMAVFWLDLVRYADTVGYHGDQEHSIWPYRDYVIEAFNTNTPFDRFTIEQLAGDLLEEPTQDQLVATAYNRLLQTTHEGGLQLKEYRAIYMADRVRNVSGVWMGATVGCAQCHDHKYDPYTARDFHALGAFFADVDDEEHLRDPYGGLNALPTRRAPEMRVIDAAARIELGRLDGRIADLEAERRDVVARFDAERQEWEEHWRRRLDRAEIEEVTWVDDDLDTGGRTQGDWSFVVDPDVAPRSGERYRRQTSTDLVQHYSVETERTIVVREDTSFLAWIHLDREQPPAAVMLQLHVAGSWEHRAVWGSDAIPYGRRAEDWPGYRRRGALPEPGEWSCLEVDAEAVGLEVGQVVDGIAFTQFGGTAYWDRAAVRFGAIAPVAVIEALAVPDAARTARDRRAIAEHQEATAPALVAIRQSLEGARAERDAIVASMPLTMYTRALAEPRPVHFLPRGNWLDETGPFVEPDVPGFLGPLSVSGRASRLDLARWLVTEEGAGGVAGLTARVFVNRVWAMLFGEGLCPSVEDFGGQGRPANHPELLDQLALDFVESGWDVKALMRRLVLTRTYGLSSVPTAEQSARDPLNELFARQSRYRVPAEFVRDIALDVGGLLVEGVGGRSVKPAQPEGYYRHLNFPKRRYMPDTGVEQWRRGVYVHWQRQYLHPMLRAFDAPSREDCTARRPRSNTPLAALTLLNDPVMVAAARAFAERIVTRTDRAPADAIRAAWRRATGRWPTDREVAVLEQLWVASRDGFSAAPEQVAEMVGAEDLAAGANAAIELAAWMQVTRALLNLNETYQRE